MPCLVLLVVQKLYFCLVQKLLEINNHHEVFKFKAGVFYTVLESRRGFSHEWESDEGVEFHLVVHLGKVDYFGWLDTFSSSDLTDAQDEIAQVETVEYLRVFVFKVAQASL